MADSVPGRDLAEPSAELRQVFDQVQLEKYQAVLARLATPYKVDRRGRASRSEFSDKKIDASTGVVSTVRDLSLYARALGEQQLLQSDAMNAMWSNVTVAGTARPTGLGWFVQTYNGEKARLALRLRAGRVLVADRHDTRQAPHADPAGQQRRPERTVRPCRRRRLDVAVRGRFSEACSSDPDLSPLPRRSSLWRRRWPSADWFITPFIGAKFEGATSSIVDLDDGASNTRMTLGVSTTILSDQIFGVEGEFGYTPRFFERSGDAISSPAATSLTLMGNVVAAVPKTVTRDSLRPYVVGGVGLIHISIDDVAGILPVNSNLLGHRRRRRRHRTADQPHERAVRSAPLPQCRRGETSPGSAPTSISFWRATVGVVAARQSILRAVSSSCSA